MKKELESNNQNYIIYKINCLCNLKISLSNIITNKRYSLKTNKYIFTIFSNKPSLNKRVLKKKDNKMIARKAIKIW